MNTRNFRTRQEFKNMTNPKGKDYIIGLDVGYSSTKVFYENGYFCFPSYAKRLPNGMMELPDEKDILYKDEETGNIYMVGYVAQDMIESTDTNDTEGELFSRKRYNNKKFKIICDVALAIATKNKQDDRKIVIQTGLPTSYVEGDSPAIKNTLSKKSSFSLKIGAQPWKHYEIEVQKEDIYVMPQPSGSLYSVLIQNDGKDIENAKKFLSSNVLVMDIGFGTFDFFGIKNRSTVCKESIDEIGMREVLSNLSKKLLNEYHEDIRVAALQKNLETGTIICIDEDEMRDEEIPLGPILEQSNKEIMKIAMDRAKNVTNAFRGYSYIIVAGGTGEAWYDYITQWLGSRKSIKVLPSNMNDHLPFIYSNARGYYLFRYKNNKKNRR